MTAYVLEDYLRKFKQEIAHLPFRERDAVVREVKAHLKSEAGRLREEDPSLSADEAMLQATAAFGEPEELGVAYGPQGGVVRKKGGDRLLAVAVLTGRGVVATAKATGRGARHVLKWTAIVALVLLVAGLVTGLTLLLAYQGTVDKLADKATSYSERTLVSRSQAYTTPTPAVFSDSFSLSERTVKSELSLSIAPSNPAVGCLSYTITGPGGTVAADTTGSCPTGTTSYSFTAPGTYTIQYKLVAFQGTLFVFGRATDIITP
jgi:hypothetical protein